jgi:hypothetical protein
VMLKAPERELRLVTPVPLIPHVQVPLAQVQTAPELLTI